MLHRYCQLVARVWEERVNGWEWQSCITASCSWRYSLWISWRLAHSPQYLCRSCIAQHPLTLNYTLQEVFKDFERNYMDMIGHMLESIQNQYPCALTVKTYSCTGCWHAPHWLLPSHAFSLLWALITRLPNYVPVDLSIMCIYSQMWSDNQCNQSCAHVHRYMYACMWVAVYI